MDCFLSVGIEVIFRLALALLLIGKRELLVQGIEGVIRVMAVTFDKLSRDTDYLKLVRQTSSLIGFEIYSKVENPILNKRAKCISKLVKQVFKPAIWEVSCTVILHPQETSEISVCKRERFKVSIPCFCL